MIDLVQRLAGRKPIQSLKPVTVWDAELDDTIKMVVGEWAERKEAGNHSHALSVLSGMHLWNDSLDASHTISQNLHTPSGSYWHAIMHRMEGDYWNSKYWYNRVGKHPVFSELSGYVKELLAEEKSGRVRAELEALVRTVEWDPNRFVDAVERQVEKERDEAVIAVLERVQWCETALLLRYCYRAAGEGADIDLNDIESELV
ncbi:hypothetical protein FE783_11635 [Paenibacillus mesophilus]|uniref:hypothetical protein n=1 Tax=Paenibacillus mesophilus TaxID=2582849 RepID=UPI00110D4101|nr:hypothetical protein [Paenibacillus mesophilus]TMV50202.1 hypothetical protein FE783_11635 [Paenibacillus mesophilus]